MSTSLCKRHLTPPLANFSAPDLWVSFYDFSWYNLPTQRIVDGAPVSMLGMSTVSTDSSSPTSSESTLVPSSVWGISGTRTRILAGRATAVSGSYSEEN